VLEAFAYIVNSLYVRNASGPDIRELVSVEELDVPTAAAVPQDGWWPPEIEPFTIYEDDLVHVRGTLNNHPPVYPSFAIRFDTPYGAVTFSGDTTPHPNVTALAAGSALLVHEIMYAEEMVRHGMPEALVQVLLSTHTDVTQIGEIARTAGVGALALSHVVPLEISSSRPPELPDARWVDAIRPSFEGPIHVGRDLMRITLS
jgi:ribonuclease BN (tRNA processing enzyme)